MKLSISNIAWLPEDDEDMYQFLFDSGFSGLEIAPTRIFPDSPYDRLSDAKAWSASLKDRYNLSISSMQSIWFGRSEMLFGSDAERMALFEYTKKAILFAEAIGCKNLVFGCPKSRNLPEGADPSVAIDFFDKIASFAFSHNTVIGMEANPPIYNTNYINDTLAAIDLIDRVSNSGFKLNLDIGTMIYNSESLDILSDRVDLINHVHISEPALKPIERRDIHIKLIELLKKNNYQGYISIEMSKGCTHLKDIILYLKELAYN